MAEKKLLGYMLGKLHRLHMAAVKEKIKPLDIQPGHLPFIATLLDNETPMIQDDIGSHVFIDKSVAARGIDSLEKKGFLNRSINPENRRQKLVELTNMSRNIKQKLFDSLNKASEELLSALSPEEQDRLMDLLDRMLHGALKR
ncbi:MarR family winged helix-turn-helix transcriptional regulator [Desulfobacula toluolica]|uniref:Transcriptional regulator, MarR family n=1 Tax=Desulfobacula toluolica (strain DSM 7467 / Tol2) TaxID=651182 RepID=K0NC11_DESTT|nr:MarR family transcriptional regulator [Desulfobacula toluolica]CCK78291.1 transcriptional regulator, MarR family [Desulfobacula toluolica Tol2]